MLIQKKYSESRGLKLWLMDGCKHFYNIAYTQQDHSVAEQLIIEIKRKQCI